jgi:hypothetical protein
MRQVSWPFSFSFLFYHSDIPSNYRGACAPYALDDLFQRVVRLGGLRGIHDGGT